jgi:hypothetical protein
MIVRLNHRWKDRYPRELLDTEAGDLTEQEAVSLTEGRYAATLGQVMREGPKGTWTVDLAAGSKKVKGRAKAIAALRADGARD